MDVSESSKNRLAGFDFGGLVAVVALGGLLNIAFVYSYLDMMGRNDLFLDAVAGDNVTGYILALGAIFGVLAFLVFVLPSYFLILASDVERKFVSKKRLACLHKDLLSFCSIFIVLMVMAVLCAVWLDREIVIPVSFFVLLVLCGAVSLFWFKKRYFRPPLKLGERIGWGNYISHALGFCFMITFIVFLSSVYTYAVAMVVLELKSWDESVLSVIKAIGLSLLNMLATLIPAAFFFVSEGGKASMRFLSFSSGCVAFALILIFSVPKIMDVARYNVARIIGVNDDNVWVYKISDDSLKSVFSRHAVWKDSFDSNADELSAKLLYGVGGVKVLCPKDVGIDIRKEGYNKKDALGCVLINSEKVVKVGLLYGDENKG